MNSLQLTEITDCKSLINFEVLKFNGGEMHIKIDPTTVSTDVLIESSITSSDELMLVLLSNDALRRIPFVRNIDLLCPYIPYARQDRVMVKGEPLSIKVLANLINSCNFRHVYVMDPHSEVSTALINNVQEIDWTNKIMHLTVDRVIVAPDQGAVKKLYKHCATLAPSGFIAGSKTRNVSNGEITGYTLEQGLNVRVIEQYQKLEYWVIDDICDGGKTFIELAKLFPEGTNLNLYITHGIFSKGIGTIEELKKYYKRIVTTNSIPLSKSVKFTKDVEVINITTEDLAHFPIKIYSRD